MLWHRYAIGIGMVVFRCGDSVVHDVAAGGEVLPTQDAAAPEPSP